jgi:hypothetical protein
MAQLDNLAARFAAVLSNAGSGQGIVVVQVEKSVSAVAHRLLGRAIFVPSTLATRQPIACSRRCATCAVVRFGQW